MNPFLPSDFVSRCSARRKAGGETKLFPSTGHASSAHAGFARPIRLRLSSPRRSRHTSPLSVRIGKAVLVPVNESFSGRGGAEEFGIQSNESPASNAADCIYGNAECDLYHAVKKHTPNPLCKPIDAKMAFQVRNWFWLISLLNGVLDLQKRWNSTSLLREVGRNSQERFSTSLRPEYRNESWLSCVQQSRCRVGLRYSKHGESMKFRGLLQHCHLWQIAR